MLNIILWFWFYVNPSFELPDSRTRMKMRISSIELDLDVKCKRLEPSLQGEPIDLENPFQTLQELGQLANNHFLVLH